jgi:hypothetical protein
MSRLTRVRPLACQARRRSDGQPQSSPYDLRVGGDLSILVGQLALDDLEDLVEVLRVPGEVRAMSLTVVFPGALNSVGSSRRGTGLHG